MLQLMRCEFFNINERTKFMNKISSKPICKLKYVYSVIEKLKNKSILQTMYIFCMYIRGMFENRSYRNLLNNNVAMTKQNFKLHLAADV